MCVHTHVYVGVQGGGQREQRNRKSWTPPCEPPAHVGVCVSEHLDVGVPWGRGGAGVLPEESLRLLHSLHESLVGTSRQCFPGTLSSVAQAGDDEGQQQCRWSPLPRLP